MHHAFFKGVRQVDEFSHFFYRRVAEEPLQHAGGVTLKYCLDLTEAADKDHHRHTQEVEQQQLAV